ncbi:MAG: class I adenylate-forming enzyme family protein [Acidimicrobiia bacterium]
MNLADLLIDHPFTDEQPLLHDLHRSWTAGEARDAVCALAAQIIELDLGGRGVAVNLDGGVDVVLAMNAIWHAGSVFIPVNPRLPSAAVDELLDQLRPAAIITAAGIRRLDHEPTVYEPGSAFVLWTSGTTGRPKPVLQGHVGYLEFIDRVLGPLRAKATDAAGSSTPTKPPSPNLIPVSMALNAGIYNALFGLRAGAPLVLMDGWSNQDFATLVHRHQIRSTILPPAAMVMLADDPDIDTLEPLRYVRSITAPLSPFQARRFMDRYGVTVLNGYGQAEIGEVVGWTAADAKDHPERLGAAGRPHPGVSVRIDDPDANGVGELLIRPPAPYADAVRATLAGRLTDDDHVRSGDLARIDEAGFVWIEGRLTDLINRGGNKIVPEEVEEVLTAVASVREAVVVAVPDDRLGQVPVAFVVEHQPVSDAELEAACRAHLVAYKVPVRFHRVDAIPRSEVGKVLRRDLHEPS